MTPDTIAALHAASFDDMRGWSAAEVAAMLEAPGAVLVTAQETGFALGRVILDEGELFTVAVRPEARHRGAGTRLVAAWEAAARAAGAARAFLEVAPENAAARALYARAGWSETGRRRDYYGTGRDAILMAKALTPRAAQGQAGPGGRDAG